MVDETGLKTILREWAYTADKVKKLIPRNLESLKRIKTLEPDLVWVIQGVRRCGKSTLLYQWVDHFRLDPLQCCFVNFEDPRLIHALDYTLLDQISGMMGTDQPKYFFLDEIQNVSGWEKWLHSQIGKKSNHYFIITGSNATLLSGTLSSALTGRHRNVEVYPFSFLEFKLASSDQSFERFIQHGGFPKTFFTQDAEGLLREYFQDIVEKDIRKNTKARSNFTLQQLGKCLFDSIGSETSLRKLSNILEISVNTLKLYVEAFCNSYLILECPFFAYSERKRLVRPKKYYPIDLGMVDAVLLNKGLDLGKKLETTVFHALKKKYKSVYYWRGKGEVDFVVQDGTDLIPIQVTWDGAKGRHHKAYDEFKSEFKKTGDLIFITRKNVEEFLATTLG